METTFAKYNAKLYHFRLLQDDMNAKEDENDLLERITLFGLYRSHVNALAGRLQNRRQKVVYLVLETYFPIFLHIIELPTIYDTNNNNNNTKHFSEKLFFLVVNGLPSTFGLNQISTTSATQFALLKKVLRSTCGLNNTSTTNFPLDGRGGYCCSILERTRFIDKTCD